MIQKKKTYYYDLGQEEIRKAAQADKKPTILLHDCCAVCAGVPLEQLHPYFAITLYFNNSNIFPEAEYTRRLEELKRLLKEKYPDVKLIVTPYDHDGYMEDLRPYADCREGGQRCRLCYRKRMEEACRYASENGYDWFTTVMTISRQKDSKVLNAIGEELEQQFPNIRYFYSDFKKGGGQQRAIELREESGLYYQDYCGCEYSFR